QRTRRRLEEPSVRTRTWHENTVCLLRQTHLMSGQCRHPESPPASRTSIVYSQSLRVASIGRQWLRPEHRQQCGEGRNACEAHQEKNFDREQEWTEHDDNR